MQQVHYWEAHLLDLAHSALDSGSIYTIPQTGTLTHPFSDQQVLRAAYQRCEVITKVNSKTFFLSSMLLPDRKRRAAQALYAFCRVSDDLVDRAEGDIASSLAAWRRQIVHLGPHSDGAGPEPAVRLAWEDARRAFEIPRGYVEQLIDGLALDLHRVRYASFAELARYCYGVACTVGLMSMHITGYAGPEAIPYAIRLGVALQLTNILRDVGEDWRSGRLYLPADELRDFDLDETDIARGVQTGQYDQRWRGFMQSQIARARRLYADALPGVSLLHKDGRFAIAAAGELYQAILDQIESNDYDVFTRRAALGGVGKLRRLPGIWWRSNRRG